MCTHACKVWACVCICVCVCVCARIPAAGAAAPAAVLGGAAAPAAAAEGAQSAAAAAGQWHGLKRHLRECSPCVPDRRGGQADRRCSCVFVCVCVF